MSLTKTQLKVGPRSAGQSMISPMSARQRRYLSLTAPPAVSRCPIDSEEYHLAVIDWLNEMASRNYRIVQLLMTDSCVRAGLFESVQPWRSRQPRPCDPKEYE